MDTTLASQVYNFDNSNQELCEWCSGDNMGRCNFITNLHPYYLAGGVSTIIGSLFVIISYIFIPKLRYHPSILIFYRAIFDLGLGISFTTLSYLHIHNLICNSIPCDIMGFINLFLFLCSINSYIALSYDLYQSIKNPFSLPKTQNIKMTNIIIIVSALLLSAIARLRYKFTYRRKLQYCSFREYNHAKQSFNPYSIAFLYTPLIIAAIIAILVTIYAAKRLIKGLPHTFESRKSAIRNAWRYSIVITFYMGMVGAFYFISWGDYSNNPIWDKLYALILPSFGIADFVVWIITNYDKCKNNTEYDRNRGKSNYQPHIEQLKLKHPQDIFEDIQNDIKQDSCGKRCCNRIGISVVNDKDNVMINEALRREVLAYTTDGISQSVENCDKSSSLTSVHYPQNIKDIRVNVIASFSLKIEKNFGLVGKHPTDRYKKSSVFCRCCCIKSTQQKDMLQVPLRPVSSFQIRAVEIDSDFDRSEERQFVDYAPIVFRYIRTKIMKINDDHYQESITPRNSGKQESVLQKSKIGDGKSGAFFFISHDSKYVVKTLSKTEVKFLISILKDYVEYLKKNPYTILSRYVGLHSLKIYGLTKYFVVMENVFEGNLRPKEIYDLKGSWIHRATNDEDFAGSTMKDCDLKRPIVMDKQNRDRILMQLNEDTLFLQQHHIMDYSILLGIYYLKIEFQSIKQLNGINEEKQQENNNKYLYPKRSSLSGIRARINECPGIYFIGIIDTLQEYTIKKKLETWLKVYIKRTSSNGISSVDPELYQKRFMNYMNHVIISEHEYKSRLKIPNQPLMIEKVLIYASTAENNMNINNDYNNRNDEIQVMRSKKIKMKNNNIKSNRLNTPIRPRTFSSNQLVVENRFAHSPASFHHNMIPNDEKLEEYEHVIDHDILDVVDDQQEIVISDIQTNVSENDSMNNSIRDTESAF